MNYNTSLSNLVLPEYGRNVQRLIEHAKTIEDAEYRQAFVEKIVKLIDQMHPQNRNVEEYRAKIWGEVLLISGYTLDVQTPENVKINPEDDHNRPAKVPYPKIKSRFRHYGKNVLNMIHKAIEMEDNEKKTAFTEVIGAYMKMAFKTWNRENVSDDQIRQDLLNLSQGKLELPEGANLESLLLPSKKRHRNNGHGKGSGKNNSGKKSGNKNYKRRKNY
ncbi:MAG: DUF4290 domain-containing protein [Bacteroidota bacterium]